MIFRTESARMRTQRKEHTRQAAAALMAGMADAACMIDSNHHLFSAEGILRAGSTRVLFQAPCYDHCNRSAGPVAPPDLIECFRIACGDVLR